MKVSDSFFFLCRSLLTYDMQDLRDDRTQASKVSFVSKDMSEEYNIFDNSSLMGSLVEDEEVSFVSFVIST